MKTIADSESSLRGKSLHSIIRSHKRWDVVFAVLGVLAMMVGVMTLVALFANMVIDGGPRLSAEFFTSFPSRRAGQAGILSAWVGSILVMFMTALVAVPIGIAGAIYLEEYARRSWFTDVIEINITNLAGVPSGCWLWACSSTPSAWARASCRPV